jgi:predicted metalloendopeptidase
MRVSPLFLVLFFALPRGFASPAFTDPAPDPTVAPPAPPSAQRSGLYLQNFDRSVRPQDDLYRFVNGTWLRETQIPADRAEYGIFTQIDEVVERQLRAIAEESAADAAASGERRLLGNFYASFMDEAAIEAAGVTPLRPELARIEAVRTPEDVLRYFARAEQLGIRNPLDPEIFADAKRPDVNVVWVEQFGLALPERDYYLKDDERLAPIRTKYVVYVGELLASIGHPDPEGAAQRVMALETRLARAASTPVELRDLTRIYNPFDLAAARKATPGLDWPIYLSALGLPEDAPLVLRQPQFFTELGAALQDVPLTTWQDYLRVRLLDSSAPYLANALAKKHFAFHGTAISGTPEMKPRWKRALAEMELSIGDLLGKVYVARHFPPESKQRIDELVANFLRAYDESIDELEWMTPSTRREAHAKVAALSVKVGYPEVWKTYPGLEIRRDDLLGNVHRARASAFERDRAKLGQPVDRREWVLTPQTVNAYYNPLVNEIVFPAAILQPPFFDPTADDAVNYGAIGGVIGHEISHGFDDQGRKFDATGAMRDWWTPEDNQRFHALADRLVAQYSAVSPLPGLHVNGRLTLGENIADVSGLAVAHKAYRIALDGQAAPELDGFTGDQRFFMGWAQIWARKYREDELRRRLGVSPHSPNEYRVNVALPNLPAFAEAFGIKPGDRLYLPPEQAVRIW